MAEVQARRLHERELATRRGVFTARLYRGTDGSVGLALWQGRLEGSAPLLARVHSSCFTSEGLGALDCDCVSQLDLALRSVAEAGRGVVFYLLQEGRGAGLRNKIRDRALVQASRGALDTFAAYERLGLPRDPRSYALVPAICADLGVAPALELMTNNPAKRAALEAAGIAVQRRDHSPPASAFNSDYLAAQAKAGYAARALAPATLAPPRLLRLDPRLERCGRFVRVASYSLPVRLKGGPVWMRATAYTEPESGHDRVVLSYRPPLGVGRREVRHVFRENLSERFIPCGVDARRYLAALERAVAQGAGSVLAVPSDARLLSDRPGPSEDEDLALLHAHGDALGAEGREEVA